MGYKRPGERAANAGNRNPETKHLEPYKWKPGQSGNPTGRPRHGRNALAEEFIADCYDAWKIYGKAALITTAMTEPSVFVRVIAQLMPRDVDVTVTLLRAERLSDNELISYLKRTDRPDHLEAQASEEVLQPLGEAE